MRFQKLLILFMVLSVSLALSQSVLSEQADKEAMRKAKAEQAAIRKAEEMVAAEKEKTEREARRYAKRQEEALRKEQKKESARQAEADRRALEQERLAAKTFGTNANQKIIYDGELVRLVRDLPPGQTNNVVVDKKAEARAEKLARETRQAQEREAAQKAKANKQGKAEMLREKKTVPVPATVPATTIPDSTGDQLLDALRKKQAELDAQEGSLPIKRIQNEPRTKPITEIRAQQLAPTVARAEPLPQAKSEEFFREKKAASATSTPVIIPQSTQPEPAKINESSIAESSRLIAQTDAPPTVAPLKSSPGDSDPLLEIVRRKQAELDAQGNQSTKREPIVQPTPRRIEAVAPEPKARVVEVRPSPIEEPARVSKPSVVVPQTTVLPPESQDQLVEILRKKQAELDAQEGVTTRATPVVQTARPVDTKKSAAIEDAAAREREESSKRIRQIEAEIKAKEEAIKKTIAQPSVDPAPAPRPSAPPKISAKKSEAINAALETKSGVPTAKPLTVESGSKEGRLADLLRKYKADEITPHDYHIERAKILAEP
ncbi:MAG: hypothetical protein ABIR24_03660 [Verrucomicrobiota bacterium]